MIHLFLPTALSLFDETAIAAVIGLVVSKERVYLATNLEKRGFPEGYRDVGNIIRRNPLKVCVCIYLIRARFIGNGPHDHTGMIPIAMHELLQRGFMLAQQSLIVVSANCQSFQSAHELRRIT